MGVECENCGKKFENEYKLKRHLNRKYPCKKKIITEFTSNDDVFTCNKCGRIFNRKFNLMRHQNQQPDCIQKIDKIQESYYHNLIHILIQTIRGGVSDECVINLWNSVSTLCLVNHESTFDTMWHIIQELTIEQLSFIFLEFKHINVHPNIKKCIISIKEHLQKIQKENKSEKIQKKNISNIISILDNFLDKYS